jgi:hypothetical protein
MAGGRFDIFTKSIFRESGTEVVTWLTGLRPPEVDPVTTELIVAEARQTDEIFRVLLPGKPPRKCFLHVEVQTAGHPDMPRRMRDDWTRAERFLIGHAKGLENERKKCGSPPSWCTSTGRDTCRIRGRPPTGTTLARSVTSAIAWSGSGKRTRGPSTASLAQALYHWRP